MAIIGHYYCRICDDEMGEFFFTLSQLKTHLRLFHFSTSFNIIDNTICLYRTGGVTGGRSSLYNLFYFLSFNILFPLKQIIFSRSIYKFPPHCIISAKSLVIGEIYKLSC